jgi:hypothetical protein
MSCAPIRRGALLTLLAVAAVAVRAPGAGPIAAPDRQHWAFRLPSRPSIPQVRQTDRIRTPIDAFLLAQLEARGLTFSPAADRVTLVRRAYLDLWGLPPAPEDVDAFLADTRPDAYERLLDRLLASPHFGERWGRHWLDVVGYADTVGFDIDAALIIQAEGKWKYRDYVIRAFNADKPFDRFVVEQLAGDELTDWRHAARFTPQMREQLIATGYLRTARDESHEPESNIPLIYYGVLENTVEIVGNSLLGLTLNCCRCHDHKFDPLTQDDYYRLMALFTPAYNPKDWRPVYPWKAGVKDRGLPDVAPAEVAEIERHNAAIDRQIAALRDQTAVLRRPYELRIRETKLQAVPEAIRADVRTALATVPEKRNEIQKYLAGKLGPALRVAPQEIDAALSGADKDKLAALGRQTTELEAGRRRYGKIQALYDVGPPPPTYRLKRGNHETPGPEVPPGFIRILCDSDDEAVLRENRQIRASSGRRTALARWLTRPNSRASALLARVLVNRLWQHTFGEGIVPMADNFGTSDEPPTHPELLEWLASEFVRGGWRIKPLLKLMMMSSAYRQSSHVAGAAAEAERVDPRNRLLWRMRLRRLDAEVIRDAVLAVSGRLDPTAGGPPLLIHSRPDGMVVLDEKALPTPTARYRRSVYLLFRRAYNLSLLSVFDQPLVAVNCPARDTSAIPLQSLTMLNDAFLAEQAEAFADRVTRRVGTNRPEALVCTAFRLALARQPTAAEVRICCDLLARQTAFHRTSGGVDPRRAALVQLCHTLLNTSEFLYAE